MLAPTQLWRHAFCPSTKTSSRKIPNLSAQFKTSTRKTSKIQKMRQKIFNSVPFPFLTEWPFHQIQPFTFLTPYVPCALPAGVVAVLCVSRGSVRRVWPACPLGCWRLFREVPGGRNRGSPPDPRFPPSGRLDPGGGRSAGSFSVARALGLVTAPAAGVLGHEKGHQITQLHSCIAIQTKNLILWALLAIFFNVLT